MQDTNKLPLKGSLVLIVCVLALTSCAPPKSVAPIGGTMDIVLPSPELAGALGSGDLPRDWTLSGEPDQGALSVRRIDNAAALSAKASSQPFALMRRTRASLLATPFLSWNWHVATPENGDHPIEIVIGMINRGIKTEKRWWQIGSSESDKINRLIAIVYSETALDRGSVIGPIRNEGYPENARYVIRGGPEQGGRWLVDTVDLSLIHRQVWPKDDASKIDVVMVGVRSRTSSQPATMGLSSMRLHR